MRKGFSTLPVALLATLIVAVVSACSSANTDGEYLENGAASTSLEQILERSRLAMDEVTSYRSAGTGTFEDSSGGLSSISNKFSEYQLDDRYRFEISGIKDEIDYRFEWLIVGNQHFLRESGLAWHELEPPSLKKKTSSSLPEQFREFLNTAGIELISADEVTDDGSHVFRLEVLETIDIRDNNADGRSIELKTVNTTYLIDRESFRCVSRTVEYAYENIVFVETPGGPTVRREWSKTLYEEDYYDFDVPIVVEAPEEYIPWSGPVARDVSF